MTTKRRNVPPYEAQRMQALRDAGLTTAAIATEMARNVQTVRRHIGGEVFWPQSQIDKFTHLLLTHGRKWVLLSSYMGKTVDALRFYYNRNLRHLDIPSIRQRAARSQPKPVKETKQNPLDLRVHIGLAIPEVTPATHRPAQTRDYYHIHDPWEDTECQTLTRQTPNRQTLTA